MAVGGRGGTSVEIAVESVFGSVSATDATAIDVSGLTFVATNPTRASAYGMPGGIAALTHRHETVGTSLASTPLSWESPYDTGGDPIHRERIDSFELSYRLEDASGLGFSALTLRQILASAMGVVAKAANTYQTVTAQVSTTVYEVGAGEIGEANPGDVVVCYAGTDVLGTYHVVETVDVGTNRVTISPPTATPLAIGKKVSLCSVAYPIMGAVGATSLAVRYRDGVRSVLATGVRLAGLSIGFEGGDRRTPIVTFRLRSAWAEQSAAGTVAAALPLAGGVYAKRFGVDSMSVALGGADTILPITDWTAEASWTLDPSGQVTRSIVGMGDMLVASTQALTASITVNDSTSLRATLRGLIGSGQRTLRLAMGGRQGGGVALIIPGAHIESLPGDEVSDERSATRVTWGCGDNPYTSTSGTPTAARLAPWVLAFGSGAA